jgi:HEAT repeat protein
MRMASANANLFSEFAQMLEKSLENPDSYIRVWAIKALGLICPHMKEMLLDKIKTMSEKIHYYDFLSGKIVSKNILKELSSQHIFEGVKTWEPKENHTRR